MVMTYPRKKFRGFLCSEEFPNRIHGKRIHKSFSAILNAEKYLMLRDDSPGRFSNDENTLFRIIKNFNKLSGVLLFYLFLFYKFKYIIR